MLVDLYIKLVIWLRKQKNSNSSISSLLYGKFHVRYPDGRKSIKMYYNRAKNYCDIFGGAVYTEVNGISFLVYSKNIGNEKKEN